MIVLYLPKDSFYFELVQKLDSYGKIYKCLSDNEDEILLKDIEEIYNSEAFIMDASKINPNVEFWQDLLFKISCKTPVIITVDQNTPDLPDQGRMCYVSKESDKNPAATIINKLKRIDNDNIKIPILNKTDLSKELETNGFLNILLIDYSSFIKLKSSYGTPAYNEAIDALNKIVLDLWSKKGGFRAKDKLFKKSPNSHTYYIILEDQRKIKKLSIPGNLEAVADRMFINIQNRLFEELFHHKKNINQILMNDIPTIKIGYASTILNPCLNNYDQVNKILDQISKSAESHHLRMQERLKDFLHIIFRNPLLIQPNYQGIFYTKDISPEQIQSTEPEDRISLFKSSLYGFESLARLDKKLAQTILGSTSSKLLDFHHFNPDFLFGTAKNQMLSSELDQTCLKRSIDGAVDIPGLIFINILPSNFYHFDLLKPLHQSRKNIVLEVSESEAINNFDLMREVRETLRERKIKIAADDFGIGYAGLDRIIQLSPDIIKIDRSLIQDIHLNKNKQNYVTAIIEAAKNSNTKILAEGVEKVEEYSTLQKMGVELAQGYLLHRPKTVQEVLQSLKKNVHKKIRSVA